MRPSLAEPHKEASAETHYVWDFCKNRSRSVEVFYRNMDGDKILTRLHFQFHPEVSIVCVHVWVCGCVCVCVNKVPCAVCAGVCMVSVLPKPAAHSSPQNKFREDLVERVKWNVNRDSPEDKLRDFLDWMKAVKKETLHHVCVW